MRYDINTRAEKRRRIIKPPREYLRKRERLRILISL